MPSNHYIHHGGWDASTRSQPALAFLEWYATTIIDTKKFDLPYSKTGTAPDWTLQKSTGEVIQGADKAWPALKEVYAPFKAHVHEPHFVSLWEADEGGWEMIGVANLWWRLQVEGEGGIKGYGGETWDGVTPAAFRFKFVKSDKGHDGVALARTEIFNDPSQAIGQMLKRGMLKPEQLM